MYLSIPIYRYWVVGGFRSHSGQLSIAASKNPSVMNTMPFRYSFSLFVPFCLTVCLSSLSLSLPHCISLLFSLCPSLVLNLYLSLCLCLSLSFCLSHFLSRNLSLILYLYFLSQFHVFV